MDVVVLNGGSSSGKTSIGRCLEELLARPWLLLGVDDLIDTAPSSLVSCEPQGEVVFGDQWRALETAWSRGVAAMARAGAGVIIDDVYLASGDFGPGVTETLPLSYTAARHVDHAYAGTVHKAQGSTVVTAHVLGTALARESGYVALSRGRVDNQLYLVQGESHLDVELDLPAPQQRQAYEQAAKTLGTSQAKRLALDTAVWGQAAEALHAKLDSTARLLRSWPPADVARLPMLRAETARLAGQVDAAQTRLGGLQKRLTGLRRRSPERPALQARVEDQTGALDRLQQRLAEAQATVTAAELGTSPAQIWTAEHTPALGRAVAAGRELSWRSRAADRAAEALNPAPDAPDIAPATTVQRTAQPPETAQPAPVRRLTRE